MIVQSADSVSHPVPRTQRVGHKDPKSRGFSIFRSAGEEAEIREHDALHGNDEGGHMSCTSGRIVSTPGAESAYKAVMTREDGATFEVSFASMGEAEAFIRRNTPSPPSRSTTYDRDPG
jgi:hypothetical protein